MSNFGSLRVKNFLSDLASKSPTPGGGSAAALVGAIAASLVEMVANLTIGKKGAENQEEEMLSLKEEASLLRKELARLADEDTRAFNAVMEAYRLPLKERKRPAFIQKALREATSVPLETARASLAIGELAKKAEEKGNKNASSDARTAGHLARAATASALENVKINLSSIEDARFKRKVEKEIEGFVF